MKQESIDLNKLRNLKVDEAYYDKQYRLEMILAAIEGIVVFLICLHFFQLQLGPSVLISCLWWRVDIGLAKIDATLKKVNALYRKHY